MARVLIGTSGWHYDSWRGPFFPKVCLSNRSFSSMPVSFVCGVEWGLLPESHARSGRKLALSDGQGFRVRVESLEIHHPLETIVGKLGQQSRTSRRPPLLAWKQSRPDPFSASTELPADADRLGKFFKMLSSNRRYSFEFRDPSWYSPRILKMLAERNISLCLSDHHDAPAPWRRTADFVYVRGHGPGGRYRGHYADRTLIEWARRIRSWKKQGKDVYVYFDNDQKSAAPAHALKLRRMY